MGTIPLPTHSHQPLPIPIRKVPTRLSHRAGGGGQWPGGTRREGRKRSEWRGLEKPKVSAPTPALGPQHPLPALGKGSQSAGRSCIPRGNSPSLSSFRPCRTEAAQGEILLPVPSAEVALSPSTEAHYPGSLTAILSTAGLPHCPPLPPALSTGLPEPVGESPKGLER